LKIKLTDFAANTAKIQSEIIEVSGTDCMTQPTNPGAERKDRFGAAVANSSKAPTSDFRTLGVWRRGSHVKSGKGSVLRKRSFPRVQKAVMNEKDGVRATAYVAQALRPSPFPSLAPVWSDASFSLS